MITCSEQREKATRKNHVGNVRLSYGIDPAMGGLKIMEENNYYPFGLKHTNYNSDSRILVGTTGKGALRQVPRELASNYNYKYNGKELQSELGLNFYDFGARNYDPAIGRWMNLDPLAEKSRRWTPYNYAYSNPVFFVDPDGMMAWGYHNTGDPSIDVEDRPDVGFDDGALSSPIYGANGQFLGTDNEGFKGEALFMDETAFNLLGGQGMSHAKAMVFGQTLSQVIGDNPAETFSQSEANMVNNAITHMVSKTAGYESNFITGFGTPFSSQLHNGITSVSYYEQIGKNGKPVWMQSNDGGNLGGVSPALATTDRFSDLGKALITFNLDQLTYQGLTVENIQNIWDHEYGGHFIKNIPGCECEDHAKALFNQSLHPSWQNTTERFKINIRDVYKEYTGRNLKR
jgi:RHS repeat-associated protein